MNQVLVLNNYNLLKQTTLMKSPAIYIIMFVVFFTTSLVGQEKTWLDKNSKISTKDSAKYYFTKTKLGNGYWIKEYYKSGKIHMEGLSKVALGYKKNFDGVINLFFETGELKEEQFYIDGKKEGVWKTYYKNGKIKSKGKYRNGEKVGVWKTFYKNVY